MFTGVIQQTGVLRHMEQDNSGCSFVIDCDYEQILAGESISVNGICLTAEADDSRQFKVHVSPETQALTTVAQWQEGQCLNLEKALTLNQSIGGHWVLGHVDTTARVSAVYEHDEYREIILSEFIKPAVKYLIPKGSLAVDGISLTLNEVNKEGVKLMIVPYTLTHTNLFQLHPGSRVNIEFDYLARIIAHQLDLLQSPIEV